MKRSEVKKQKRVSYLKNSLLVLFVFVSFLTVPAHAQSALPPGCKAGQVPTNAGSCCPAGEVPVSIQINGKSCITNGTTISTNVIYVFITSVLKFMSAGIGVLATGGVIVGGYLYMTARGNSAQVQRGVTTIINSGIAIILFGLMFALLNYLVPGGVFQ